MLIGGVNIFIISALAILGIVVIIGYQATQSNITLLAIILIYLTIPSIISLAHIFDKSITPNLANKILLINISFYFSVIILIKYIL